MLSLFSIEIPISFAFSFKSSINLISISFTQTFLRYFGHHIKWYPTLKTLVFVLLYLFIKKIYALKTYNSKFF